MYEIKKVEQVTVEKEVVIEATLEQYVGYQLLKAREAKKWSHQETILQVKGAISVTHLRNIEKGLPTLRLKDMELLCSIYGLEVACLFPPIITLP